MNQQPISLAHDPDLRLSEEALRRAAKRARVIARQTGTQLVYCYHGEVLRISPDEQDAIEAAWIDEAQRRLQTYDRVDTITYSVSESIGGEDNPI